jgi:uncharacterized RDD family membrane protein YckC
MCTLCDPEPATRSASSLASAQRGSRSGAARRARLRASAVDLLAIWAWLGAAAALSRLPVLRRTGYAALFRRPATVDAAQFATGVLPVALYLAAGEAGRAHATRGKRAAGLVVLGRDGLPPGRRRILVRTAVKLLPWQLAHLAVTRAAGVGVARSPKLAGAGFGVALATAGVSVGLAASRPDGRALHDLAAGTRVVATHKCN